MFLNIVIITLILSVSIHGASIVFYFLNRKNITFLIFIGTFITNLISFGLLFYYFYKNPVNLKEINFIFYAFLLSGFTSILLLSIKINIARKIIKRRKDKNMYHLNYFGKRVYHGEIILKKELTIFIGSIPFFLLTAAFFVAVIINLIRFGSFYNKVWENVFINLFSIFKISNNTLVLLKSSGNFFI